MISTSLGLKKNISPLYKFIAGYKWADIVPCVQWMAPFAVTLRELGPMEVKFFSNIPSEDSHNIQTHVVDLNLLVSNFSLYRQHPEITEKMLTGT